MIPISKPQIDRPIAEKLSQGILSLPVHPGLSSEDLSKIVEGVNSANI